jgi:hypothetical protein
MTAHMVIVKFASPNRWLSPHHYDLVYRRRLQRQTSRLTGTKVHLGCPLIIIVLVLKYLLEQCCQTSYMMLDLKLYLFRGHIIFSLGRVRVSLFVFVVW